MRATLILLLLCGWWTTAALSLVFRACWSSITINCYFSLLLLLFVLPLLFLFVLGILRILDTLNLSTPFTIVCGSFSLIQSDDLPFNFNFSSFRILIDLFLIFIIVIVRTIGWSRFHIQKRQRYQIFSILSVIRSFYQSCLAIAFAIYRQNWIWNEVLNLTPKIPKVTQGTS